MVLTRLTEPADYARRRQELAEAEMALMEQRERVAALRRGLGEGVAVEDYVFFEGPPSLEKGDEARPVRLSELFGSPDRALVVYHLMFGKAQTSPCPMCTLWVDGLNAVAHHLAQNVDVAVAAAADVPTLRAHARARGWDRLRLLSCGESSFKYDLGSEDGEGNQDSTVSVFTLGADGAPRHFYSAHPAFTPAVRERGIDLLCPVWHVLDLTPAGRGDWYAQLDYGR
ncbi:MAG TPA: DUF899 family protein [Acidimicrobiales bacterium]|nr:DUF899 family protein [Acidimicrobiales bacterium]